MPDPTNPAIAQDIVVQYARALERHTEQNLHPAPVSLLPYPKATIRDAIRTSVLTLQASGQLAEDLREYLEVAYASLADYLDDELVRLVHEYREAGAALGQAEAPAERMASPAWKTVSESGELVGRLAQSMALETESLRSEFRGWLDASGA